MTGITSHVSVNTSAAKAFTSHVSVITSDVEAISSDVFVPSSKEITVIFDVCGFYDVENNCMLCHSRVFIYSNKFGKTAA